MAKFANPIPAAVEALQSILYLPEGWHTVTVTKVDPPIAASTGKPMELIHFANSQGSISKSMHYFDGHDEQAKRISLAQVSYMAALKGLPQLQDTAELVGLTLDVYVQTRVNTWNPMRQGQVINSVPMDGFAPANSGRTDKPPSVQRDEARAKQVQATPAAIGTPAQQTDVLAKAVAAAPVQQVQPQGITQMAATVSDELII